ncbi:MAG: methyltransferase domain-containing protein [Rhodocyclaceae bacterium]|nr:methyltransferase domain-containing protein [Rhodocyclaceae bacterium]
MSRRWVRELARQAARRYEAAGLMARYFARGKLAGDPMFRALLSPAMLPDRARVLDLGCGAGLLAAWLTAAVDRHARGDWPLEAPPPRPTSYTGVELMSRDVALARLAIAGWPEARIEQWDLRDAALPPSDVILLLDVLHYLEPASQEALLTRVARALSPAGQLVLRVGDAGAGGRFRYTMAVDRLVCRLRGLALPALHGRSLPDWLVMLDQLGFAVETHAMSEGTPFANVLLVARHA